MFWTLFFLLFAPAPLLAADDCPVAGKEPCRVRIARKNVEARIKDELYAKGMTLGNRVMIRHFKVGDNEQEAPDREKIYKDLNKQYDGTNRVYGRGQLEVWVADDMDNFKLFKSYRVCIYSGELGPKKKEGDGMTPEGFYSVALFNPVSSYHLSMDVGYPNAFDRAYGRTGSEIMIHSKCASIGCMAMGDVDEPEDNTKIEEIYLLALEAKNKGQKNIPVHLFPFRMTSANMKKYSDGVNDNFWKMLKVGYDYFEDYRLPPTVVVKNREYVIEPYDPLSLETLSDAEREDIEIGRESARASDRLQPKARPKALSIEKLELPEVPTEFEP